MAKVLGGNPFDPNDEPTEAGKRRPAKGEKSAEASKPETPVAVPEAAPDEGPLDHELDAAPDTVPPDEAFGEVFYGEEAAPAPGDYGPGLDRRTEIPYTRPVTDEVREIERRVKARLSPAFPIEQRRKVPL